MGTHIRAVAQRKVNGTWRHLLDCPVSPVRLEWYTYPHYAFMAYGGCIMADGSIEWDEEEDNYAIARARGCPDDFNINQWESVEFFDPTSSDGDVDVKLPWDGYDISWLTLDELVNHDYDRVVTRFGVTKPLREFLGEQFIAFWKDMQAKGAQRIVFSWA